MSAKLNGTLTVIPNDIHSAAKYIIAQERLPSDIIMTWNEFTSFLGDKNNKLPWEELTDHIPKFISEDKTLLDLWNDI